MIRSIRVNVDPQSTKYPADDIPGRVLRWIEHNKRIAEPERTDLSEGQVVVILEGKYTSRRAVLLKKLPQNLVLCSGPSNINGVPFVVLNQRYLLPVSINLGIKVDIPVHTEAAEQMKQRNAENAVDLDASSFIEPAYQQVVDSAIEAEIRATKGMKSYFMSPFSISEGYCPMELNY